MNFIDRKEQEQKGEIILKRDEVYETFSQIILKNLLETFKNGKIMLIGSIPLFYAGKAYVHGRKQEISNTIHSRDFDMLVAYQDQAELTKYLNDNGTLNVIDRQSDEQKKNNPYILNSNEMTKRGIDEIRTCEWTFNHKSTNTGAKLLLNICGINEFMIDIDIIKWPIRY